MGIQSHSSILTSVVESELVDWAFSNVHVASRYFVLCEYA